LNDKTVNLANFNCTFKVHEEILPMLHYFNHFIYRALNKEYVRETKSASYYLDDVQVIEIPSKSGKPELCLIGKHVKRVKLEIKNDYEPGSGFVHIGQAPYSAPYSTFILLLRNHRIIHFKDQKGSPEVQSLTPTIKHFLKQFRKEQVVKERREPNTHIKEQFQNYDGTLHQFLTKVIYPQAEVNIVPIPEPSIVKEKMRKIKKIYSVKYRVYPLNAEIDMSEFLSAIRNATEVFDTPSGEVSFNGPKNIEEVTTSIEESRGLADFTLKGQTNTEKLTLKPEMLTENIEVPIDDNASLVEQSKEVYNFVKDKEEIANTSQDNQDLFDKYLTGQYYWMGNIDE
jgi:hypothetical protein